MPNVRWIDHRQARSPHADAEHQRQRRARRRQIGTHRTASQRCMPAPLRAAEGALRPVFADVCEPSDVAVLVVDARDALAPEARQSAAIARTAGIRHIVLAVNRLELVGWDRTAFEALKAAFARLRSEVRVHARRSPFRSARRRATTSLRAARIRPGTAARRLREHLATLDIADADAPRRRRQRTQLSEQFAAHIACVSDQELLPGPRIQIEAGRARADGERHGGEVSPGRRQPAPRAGAHAGAAARSASARSRRSRR